MKCNKTDTSKSYGWIVMTFSANDLNGARNKWLDLGSDLDHCLDHLDPGYQMCLCTLYLKSLWTDFDEISRICLKR